MVFSSNIFLYMFLPIVLAGYFGCVLLMKLTGLRFRIHNCWLLIASLLFYAWGATWFCAVMMATIVIDYAAGLAISGTTPWGKTPIAPLSVIEDRSRGQLLALIAALSANLAVLAFFKYANFGVDSYNALVGAAGLESLELHAALRIALPLGISFFTFQAMSYTIDVYLGKIAATRNLLDFLTFGAFFPVLVSGPIMRYETVAADMVGRSAKLEDFAAGVRRFIIGLSKKVLIANVLAVPADAIFGLRAEQLTTPLAWLAAFSYTLQIYFDFSGYSDMAIGLARMFGFHLPENFNYPYSSRSITEFWRRWHISLSSWFRDYVFIPLNMAWREWMLRGTVAAIIVTFLLTGLWHGASWTFVIWGVYHGALIVIERLVGLERKGGWRERVSPLRHAYTLLAVMIGWVFFRSDGFTQGLAFIKAMAGFAGGDSNAYYPALYFDGEMIAATAAAVVFSWPWIPDWIKRINRGLIGREGFPGMAAEGFYGFGKMAIYFVLLFVAVVKLSSSTHNPFIYFRF